MAVRTKKKKPDKQTYKKRRIIAISLAAIVLISTSLVVFKIFKDREQDIKTAEEQKQQQQEQQSQQNQEQQQQEEQKPVIKGAKTDWNLILVSAKSPLPDDFDVTIDYIWGGYRGDARVKKAVNNMIDAAAKDGITLTICSGYRTKATSASLYKKEVQSFINKGYSQKEAEKEAARWVAPPGTSEHHTGLAFDIVTPSYQALDHGFADTKAAKWMKKNCAKYGLILRYPKDKQKVTGITFEPWHFRYVGTDHAQRIMDEGLCLEEYLEKYFN